MKSPKGASLLSLLFLPLLLQAQVSTEALYWRIQPVYAISHSQYRSNPATIPFADSLSLSEASLSVFYADEDVPVCEQEGRGSIDAKIGAESFQHLDSVSSVWGDAHFSTGRLRDVRWIDGIDYRLTAPYVLGDDKGGDLNFRRYTFGGGYSKLAGERWSVGAQLRYRAEIAWRSVDPRVSTVVSDLNAEVGASYRLGVNRMVALACGVRSYSQSSDVDFYNPINDIDTYPLTGLGTYYQRFAGNTNKNSGHQGLGYDVSMQSLSLDGSGLLVAVDFSGQKMNLYLRNFNNIIPAFTVTYHSAIEATYAIALGQNVRLQPDLKVSYDYRLGTENIFGTSAGASYIQIGYREQYVSKNIGAVLSLPMELSHAMQTVSIVPIIGYNDSYESLKTPARSLKFSAVTPGIRFNYSALRNQWLWAVSGICSYSCNISKSFDFPDYDSKVAMQYAVSQYYDMSVSNVATYGFDVSASHMAGGMVYGLSIGCRHASYHAMSNAFNIYSSFNVHF